MTTEGHVAIALEDDRRLSVEAVARDGVWAVTRHVNGAGYRVSHVPTGRAVGPVHATCEEACARLAMLGERFPRWEREAELGERVDADVVLAVIEAST